MPSSSPTISTSTNRITALGGSNYYYDANGSLTQDDLFKYKYDAENRVVEIRNLSDTLLASYAAVHPETARPVRRRDGNSMQVIKVVGGTRWWFLYAGGQLVSEFADSASATYSAGTTPGSAPSDSVSTVLYQHADHLTTRVTTENDGDLSNQQAHYPYGESWYTDGTADPSPPKAGKFTSYRKETDSSLASGQINYAVARYHGARIGRFHRPDPVRGRIGNPQRLNRYAYVVGDPTNRFDPTGTDDALDKGPIDGIGGMDLGPPDPLACGGEECIFIEQHGMGWAQGVTGANYGGLGFSEAYWGNAPADYSDLEGMVPWSPACVEYCARCLVGCQEQAEEEQAKCFSNPSTSGLQGVLLPQELQGLLQGGPLGSCLANVPRTFETCIVIKCEASPCRC
jgi:RHS repeat-associated protein